MTLEGSRVLVIGGSGFVGSHIVDQLTQEPVREIIVLDNFVRGARSNLAHSSSDPRVRIVDGSITDPFLLRDLMEGTDYVFHLAALWLHECVHQPRSAVDVNIVGTFNVAEAAVKAKVKKVVYSSSASVYGDALFTPMTEEHPFNNRTMYGATKIAGEQFFRAFYEQHKLNYTGLRYMNIYGPRMDYKGTYVSVIMKVLDRIDQGKPPIIFGDGSQAYDFIHVDDVARANICALKSAATDTFFNVGMGVKTTINELVEKLLALTGSPLKPEYKPQEQMFVTQRVGSTEKATKEIAFTAKVSLDEGLRSVVEWRRKDKVSGPSSGSRGPIPITKPYFGAEELAAIQIPIRSGWVVQGPFVKKFEDRLSSFTKAPYSVATSSCTTALHLAVAALGLKPGDEVLVPAFTWVSTANVVEYMGGRPVFCDIDLETFNLDIKQVVEKITPRTVGIIPVHLFGLCADMGPLLDLARKRKLWVVEDAACALGAQYNGLHAGTMGDLGCYSFHPRKSVTTGEGGMITTAREDLAQLSRSLRDHGASRSDLTRHTSKAAFLLPEFKHLGYNYRMTDLQGALGYVQMERASWILEERTKRARRYDDLLSKLGWLRTPKVPKGYTHGYQAYVCLFRPETPSLANVDSLLERRNEVMSALEDQGIATRQGTHAPILLDYYSEKYALRREQFPNATLADRLTLALPLYVQMTDEDQERVVKSLSALMPR